MHSKTPDGRSICYKYQTGKCTATCNMVHVCQICFGTHPSSKCNKRKLGGNAADAAPAVPEEEAVAAPDTRVKRRKKKKKA